MPRRKAPAPARLTEEEQRQQEWRMGEENQGCQGSQAREEEEQEEQQQGGSQELRRSSREQRWED